jgi:hypothetical protein
VVLNALTNLAPGTLLAISCATEPASIVSGSYVAVSTGLVMSTNDLAVELIAVAAPRRHSKHDAKSGSGSASRP